jgi:hypothetical protein
VIHLAMAQVSNVLAMTPTTCFQGDLGRFHMQQEAFALPPREASHHKTSEQRHDNNVSDGCIQ